MAGPKPPDPNSDPFRPPEIPVEVGCLHCGETYDSFLIEWREEQSTDGSPQGFWCCPTPGCGGVGFGFDILPTDPNYRDERGGWVCFDDEDEDYDEEDELEEDFLPQPPSGFDHKSNGDGKHSNGGIDDIPF